MASLTDDLFRKIAHAVPSDVRLEILKWLNKYCYEYNITTERRLAAAIGRWMVESGNFTRTSENLNYSAARLMKVWPKRFRTLDVAKQYEHQPKKLANFVYGSRGGNRPGTDDGWTYRGGGFGQTTFRDGYETLGEEIGVDLVNNPEWLRTPEGAVKSACAEFAIRGCNKLADQWQLTRICEKINGGHNGLQDQIRNSERVLSLLPDGFVLTKPSAASIKPTAMSEEVLEQSDMVDAGTPAFLEDAETVPEDTQAGPDAQNAPEQPQTTGSVTQTAENIVNTPGGTDVQDTKVKIEAAAQLPDTHVEGKSKTGFLAKIGTTIFAIVTGQITFADFLTKGLSLETLVNSLKTVFDVAFAWRYIIAGSLALWFVVNKFESIYLKSKAINANTDPTRGNVILTEPVAKLSVWQRMKSWFGK